MHFTNTARQLGISQPALAKAISKLEEEVGTSLLRRLGKKTYLTSHGESIRKKYSELSHIVSDVENEVANIDRTDAEKVCICVSTALDFTKFADFLAVFHKKCPNTLVNIIETNEQDGKAKLLSGEIDCLLTSNHDDAANRLIYVALYETSLAILSSAKTNSQLNHVLESKQSCMAIADLDSAQTIILKQSQDGEISSIAKCSQQLWAYQLVSAGFGFSIQAKSVCTIARDSVIYETDFITNRMIYAALPVSRRHDKPFGVFDDLLKAFNWHS